MTEKMMVKRLIERDEEAFDYCYEKYKNLVYYEIYSILKNHEATEEALQDTFLKMYQSIETFDGRFFTAWLVAIAKNQAINEYHKRKENLIFVEEAFNPQIIGEFTLDDYYTDLSIILSPFEYQIFIYKIIYNIKIKDIAVILDKSASTIHSYYHEALDKVREYFNKES